jgi:hypothetical protein
MVKLIQFIYLHLVQRKIILNYIMITFYQLEIQHLIKY